MNITVETPIETTEHSWRESESYRNELLNHKKWGPFFRKVSHDISTDIDDSAGNGAIVETDFWKKLVPALTVDIIGQDLATIINVTEPTTRYPIMRAETDLGKTTRQGRGLTSTFGRAGRLHYQELKLGKSYNTYDRVDQDFLEDVQMGVLKYYWQELHRAHDEAINQLFVDQIQNIPTAAPASGKLRPTTTFKDDSDNTHIHPVKLNLDDGGLDVIMKAYNHCKKLNFTPDCILMNPDTYLELILDEDFKNSDFYQFTGTPSGKMMQTIAGCRIMVSNMVNPLNHKSGHTDDKIHFHMWKKDRVLMCAMRRNRMIKKIENHETMEEGLAISTRLGFGIIDTTSIIEVHGDGTA